MMQTPPASLVMMGVITISNGDDVDTDSERGGDSRELVITISNGDDLEADSERGDDGGDHDQQWRSRKYREHVWR